MKKVIRNKALLNVAASSLLLGVTMVGCSTGASMMTRAGDTFSKPEQLAAASALAAEGALAKRDIALALTSAEAAVAGKPDSAAYRVLLGRAYLADGRFTSAQTAFVDAMALGNNDTRTIVSLALTKVALNQSADARTLLSAHMESIPATDYGLAMAMAGDPQEAIRILTAAAQEPDATVKTRQNLAYAYALSGQWREARLMAAQDLDPMAAGQRVVTWAQTAEQGAEPARVAAFIGTQMRADDTGMPVRLALNTAAPVQIAQTEEPVPQASTAEEPAPVAVAMVSEPEILAPTAAPVAVAAPMIRAPQTPVWSAVVATKPIASAKSMIRKVALIRPVAPSANGGWVVQLGAYDSAAIARERWQRFAHSTMQIGTFPVAYTTINMQGRTYHRLAVAGFSDRVSADHMCRTIRASGRACFIRATGPVAAPKKWAAVAKRQQLALR